ncbi:MAG: tetratricopeptide repeat protein [Opitutales bacterium]
MILTWPDRKTCWLALLLAGAATAAAKPPRADAETLYRAGNLEQAETAFRQLLVAEPDNPADLYYLGKIAVRRGDYAGAIARLERAGALAPRESDYQLWLGNAYAWAAATAPLRAKPALGRKCLAAYQQALALDQDNVSARLGLMNFYRHVPVLMGGGLDRAYAQAEEIRRRDPDRGAIAQAVLLGQEKKFDQAFGVLERLLARDRRNYAANCLLGKLALASGQRLAEGAEALRRCLALPPTESDESHELVAGRLGQLGRKRAPAITAGDI